MGFQRQIASSSIFWGGLQGERDNFLFFALTNNATPMADVGTSGCRKRIQNHTYEDRLVGTCNLQTKISVLRGYTLDEKRMVKVVMLLLPLDP